MDIRAILIICSMENMTAEPKIKESVMIRDDLSRQIHPGCST